MAWLWSVRLSEWLWAYLSNLSECTQQAYTKLARSRAILIRLQAKPLFHIQEEEGRDSFLLVFQIRLFSSFEFWYNSVVF